MLEAMLEAIDFLSDVTQPWEPIVAYDACLDTYSTLTFAGAVLRHEIVKLRPVENASRGDVIDVSVNHGAALLYWVMRALHVDNNDIIQLYRRIFAGRASTLTNYLTAIPLYSTAEQEWMRDFFEKAGDFNRFIGVNVMGESRPVRVAYDPRAHAGLDAQLAAQIAKEN